MNVATSKAREGASGSGDWQIEDWDAKYKCLKETTSCILAIDHKGSGIPIRLRFFFGTSSGYSGSEYVHLKVHPIYGVKFPAVFSVSVQNESKSDYVEVNGVKGDRLIFYNGQAQNVLSVKAFLQISSAPVKLPKNLHFKITATIFRINETQISENGCEGASGLDPSAYGSCRFILGAGNPVFRKLIEDCARKKDFSAVIKMEEENAKPLMVVLHWMFTKELQQNAEKCMEEVTQICIKFEIKDLLKILDEKLITICTTENMFQLGYLAKENRMSKALAAISEFIKELTY